VSKDEWTAVPMQGSGTFAVEAVIQTATPRTGGKVRTFVDHLSQ
jgi:aspartate aminotransferase-like enzyme